MPNRKPRGKFKSKIVGHPLLDRPTEEQYNNPETKFLAYKVPDHGGWLRVDINLHSKIQVGDIIHDIGIRITEDRNLIDQEEKDRILALCPRSAAYIARTLKLPLDRVKRIIYPRPNGVER